LKIASGQNCSTMPWLLVRVYQISQNIIVLYGGSVSEAGDVELVVRQPKHPYTQLLIGSIPSPNPRHRWAARPEATDGVSRPTNNGSCRFVCRCPYAMRRCEEQHPPLYQTDEHRVVACYMHETVQSEVVSMDQVFVR
jgi:oligopeptide/dipeptide ABC transporter ATP-binding protein